jgi:hypothetical protein
MAGSKKRVIKSLESLSEDLRELLRQQYPNGYEASITRIKNAKNEPIFVFPLETEDAVYLVKVPQPGIAKASTLWSRVRNRNSKVRRMKDLLPMKILKALKKARIMIMMNEKAKAVKPVMIPISTTKKIMQG